MSPALAFGQLPHDAAVNDVGARLEPEDGVRQRDRTCFLAVERGALKLPITRPSSASCPQQVWPARPSAPAWRLPPWQASARRPVVLPLRVRLAARGFPVWLPVSQQFRLAPGPIHP